MLSMGDGCVMATSSSFYDVWETLPDTSACLLNDDIWNKFQLSGLDMSGFDWIRALDDTSRCFENDAARLCDGAEAKREEDTKIRNHDCMWAGLCGSKEHSLHDINSSLVRPISMMFQPACHAAHATPAPAAVAPAASRSTPIAPGTSLLLRTQSPQQQHIYQQQQQLQAQCTTSLGMEQQQQQQQQQQNAVLPYYESPPNSDDEETKSPVLQYLQEYISECDLDDDDLVDYFKHFAGEEDPEIVEARLPACQKMIKEEAMDDEDGDEEEEEEEDDEELATAVAAGGASQSSYQQQPPKHAGSGNKHFDRSETLSRFVNDHCYFKDKNATMRMPETPSDSEEEIDVVSTDDKHVNPQRTVGALPTNPTTRDRQQIQMTMASAITKNGIRMIPRKGGAPPGGLERSPAKRRPDARGIKRNRHRMPISPYKKQQQQQQQRAYHAHHQLSSDSEQEPSEKRIEHNNMERQRRVDLRNAFEELRVLVPEVNKRERAPKVVILREAAVYCHKLTDVSVTIQRQVDEMRRQQRRLRSRLSHLRSSLAPKH